MAWTPLLLALLAHCSGSWAQAGLTQEASASGSVGQTVTLSCTGNSNNVGKYGAGWYQVIPGAAPKTVMLGTSRPSGIPGRFSGSRSGNTASLTISGLQPEDEANYYCSAWDSSRSAHTVLQACGEVRQKPTFSSSRRSITYKLPAQAQPVTSAYSFAHVLGPYSSRE